MEINKKIKLIRENKNITQDYISYELGITQEAYSKLERGISNLSFKQVELICNVLKITISDLLNNNIDYFLKNKSRNMKTIKNYHDNVLNRSNILRKWKPILERLTSDEWMYPVLANYCEKHTYYDNLDKSLSNEEKSLSGHHFLLPICIKILSSIKCNENQFEFDEYDIEEMKEVPLLYSTQIKKDLFKNNPNYNIDIIQKMEEELIKKAIIFIEEHINKGNIFKFQTPLIKQFNNIVLNNEEDIITMSMILKYY